MMTASETDSEEFDNKRDDNSAILTVTTSSTDTAIIKQDSRDPDFHSNYSNSIEDSVIASPSIDSFSTLPEQDSSDFELDSRDLQVKVDNPQKHLETLETYITFRITTR
ncbi:hypothetical protein PV325_009681, partial [Microctonus aethiopoides]